MSKKATGNSSQVSRVSTLVYLLPVTVLGLAIAVIIIVQSTAQRAPQQASEQTRALGKTIYDQNCASCHGLNGEGKYPDSWKIPDVNGLLDAPPHNAQGHTWHHADQQLFAITKNGFIVEGFYPMPAFGDKLSDEEIWAVIAYIKTWWQADQVASQATVTARQ